MKAALLVVSCATVAFAMPPREETIREFLNEAPFDGPPDFLKKIQEGGPPGLLNNIQKGGNDFGQNLQKLLNGERPSLPEGFPKVEDILATLQDLPLDKLLDILPVEEMSKFADQIPLDKFEGLISNGLNVDGFENLIGENVLGRLLEALPQDGLQKLMDLSPIGG